MRVLIFGDSITQGFVDSQGGWAARLVQHYNQKMIDEIEIESDWVEVFNLGVSADTTAGLTARLESEVKSRQLYPESEVIIIAIGTNDTVFRGSEYQSSPEEYLQDLKKLTQKARRITNKILFVGMCGVDDTLSNPWKYSSSGKSMTTERIKEFEKVLRDFCDTQQIPLVRLLENFHHGMYFDGIHPNDDGHKFIYDSVRPKLEKIIG